MYMETQDIKVKFQTELKWSGYYFISSLIISFTYIFFNNLIFNQTRQPLVILWFLNIIIFLYCSYKCIVEIRREKAVSFILKLLISLNILTIYYLLYMLITIDGSFSSFDSTFIMPKREIEIEETTGDISDSNSNLLKDFIYFIKIKNKQ